MSIPSFIRCASMPRSRSASATRRALSSCMRPTYPPGVGGCRRNGRGRGERASPASGGPGYHRWVDASGTPPVTSADVDLAVVLAADALNGALEQDWRVPAGGLEWDCRETVEQARGAKR